MREACGPLEREVVALKILAQQRFGAREVWEAISLRIISSVTGEVNPGRCCGASGRTCALQLGLHSVCRQTRQPKHSGSDRPRLVQNAMQEGLRYIVVRRSVARWPSSVPKPLYERLATCFVSEKNRSIELYALQLVSDWYKAVLQRSVNSLHMAFRLPGSQESRLEPPK